VKLQSIIKWIVGIILTFLGLLIFFRNVDTKILLNHLFNTNPIIIICCIFFSVLGLYFRVLRWKILLPYQSQAHSRGLFPIIAIGFMINNILPARIGEATRAFLLWKKNKYTASVSIGSLIVERGLDILTYGASFFIPVFISTIKSDNKFYFTTSSVYKSLTLQSVSLFIALITFLAVLCLIAYSLFPKSIIKIWEKIITVFPKRFQPKLKNIFLEVISTLDWTFSLKKILFVILLSFGIVTTYALIIFLFAGINNFYFLNAYFAQAFAALGAAIPLAPGYVGTLHAVLLEGLSLCGLQKEKAQAVAILFHGIPYITITAIGLYYFFKMRISFKEISTIHGYEVNKEEKDE
jgi:uncharacterized protein (TIRG00374 family)